MSLTERDVEERMSQGFGKQLEGPRQDVNQDHDAQGQDQQRKLLHLHRVFLDCRSVRHNDTSFAQSRDFENGTPVAGTPVT